MGAKSFKFLPLTLSIETRGGLSSPLVRRGTPLPARRTQTFSTASDNQKGVTIQVYLGESPIAANNILLAKCEIVDLPQAPKGDPQIDVAFEVDEECRINITAIEKTSGKQISSEVKSPSLHLTEENIQKILAKATASIEEERKTAYSIEVRNRAMDLLARAEKYLSSSTDKQVDEALASLGLSLETNDFTRIAAQTNRLEQLLPKTTFGGFGGPFNFDNIFDDIFGSSKSRQRQSAQGTHYESSRKGTQDTRAREQKLSKSGEIAKSDKGIFSAGQYFDAKRFVRDLFADAQREIVVIDPYVGEDVLSLLAVKQPDVAVKILTGKISAPFLTLARDFNRQYKGIEVRSCKTFHDRFVIIDQKEYFHFGASLEHLGNKTFMFSKIEEPIIIETLQKHWYDAWDEATKQV